MLDRQLSDKPNIQQLTRMLPEMSEATQKTPRIAAGMGMGIGNTSTCSTNHMGVICQPTHLVCDT